MRSSWWRRSVTPGPLDSPTSWRIAAGQRSRGPLGSTHARRRRPGRRRIRAQRRTGAHRAAPSRARACVRPGARGPRRTPDWVLTPAGQTGAPVAEWAERILSAKAYGSVVLPTRDGGGSPGTWVAGRGPSAAGRRTGVAMRPTRSGCSCSMASDRQRSRLELRGVGRRHTAGSPQIPWLAVVMIWVVAGFVGAWAVVARRRLHPEPGRATDGPADGSAHHRAGPGRIRAPAPSCSGCTAGSPSGCWMRRQWPPVGERLLAAALASLGGFILAASSLWLEHNCRLPDDTDEAKTRVPGSDPGRPAPRPDRHPRAGQWRTPREGVD